MDKPPKPDPELLHACYFSGQIAESHWQKHIENGDVAKAADLIVAQASAIASLAQTMEEGMWASDVLLRLQRIEIAMREIIKLDQSYRGDQQAPEG